MLTVSLVESPLNVITKKIPLQKMCYLIQLRIMHLCAGDVLSGTWLDGAWHSGVVEEWFGQHWWTTRSSLLLLTTLFVFAPLISFKRVGGSSLFSLAIHVFDCIFSYMARYTLYL